METIVVVGAGQAGGELSFALRQNGFDGRIVLVGAERHEPYQRPPLSKGTLKGASTMEQIRLRAPQAYTTARIELDLDSEVVRIDRIDKQVVLRDGRRIAYDSLALTTGGTPRQFPIGVQTGHALSLHTYDDSMALRAALSAGKHLLIVGGGFIGLEVAAVAVEAGAEVTVLESQPRILQRTCLPVVSDYFTRAHRARGVTIRTGVKIVGVDRTARGVEARLDDGSTVGADLVLAGIGSIPNDALARDAGLNVDNGILVDADARTSDDCIVAAGDCTRSEHAFLGRRIRLESMQNATEQARTAARTLCGLPNADAPVPWFWSDQYDLSLQMVGVVEDADTAVVRGDSNGAEFSVVHLRAGRVVAVDAVNRPRDFAAGRRLVAARAEMTAQEAGDENVSLMDIARRRHRPLETRA